MALLAGQGAARAAPLYDIAVLGFTDLEHTRDDGYRASYNDELTDSGYVAGFSYRYNGGATYLGRTAWLYDGTGILNIGLTDLEHTRSDGYRYSQPVSHNESGSVTGEAYRYNGGSTQLGRSAWLYDGTTTLNIGLTDTEHTRDDGYMFSYPAQFTESGYVLGTSNRYSGGATQLGTSVWLYNGATTLNVGLTDAEHTRDDGLQSSEAVDLNESGHVLGRSSRFSGGATSGYSVWLYNGTATLNIGLTDAEHTRDDGYRGSAVYDIPGITESGYVAGQSSRFNGGPTDLGSSVWFFDGTTTVKIGLTDAEHTRDDGRKRSYLRQLTESGYLTGVSERYNGGATLLGGSAWLYDGTTTLNIGLTDAEHTRDDGYRISYPEELAESGCVVGYSARYNGGSASLGSSAWLYNGATTVKIGFTDAEHTRDDGYRWSHPDRLTESGYVTGSSRRYNGGAADLGTTTWLHNGTTTVRIGLTDAEHTRDDGYMYSLLEFLSESGYVVGRSERYNGGAFQRGFSAWLYNGTTTMQIGLTDAMHTSSVGYRLSRPGQLTESGYVIGYSSRYNGGSSDLGRSAWVYDPILGTTVPLVGSVRSDGYAYSSAQYLGEDGLVLGYYEWFAPDDTFLGEAAFAWTHADGFYSLDLLVDGGLGAAGWQQLYSASQSNAAGQILGRGMLLDQTGGQMRFLLTVIPEPGTMVLLGAGLAALLRRRRRR